MEGGVVLDVVLEMFVALESLFGVLINIFIMAVLTKDWVKSWTPNPYHLILVALGLSNVCLICALLAEITLQYWAPILYNSGNIFRICNLCCYLPLTSSSWLIACLCIFYCLKIVEMKQPLFIQVKMRLSKLVPWMILLSIFISLSVGVPVFWDCYLYNPENKTVARAEWSVPYTSAIGVVGAGLPLILVALSITLTLVSLCKHTRHMKQHGTDSSTPQLQALTGAAKTMGLLLVLATCFHAANLLLMSGVQSPDWDTVATCVLTSYAPAQSFTLVLGNPKLKQALMRMVCCTPSDQRCNIITVN